MHGWLEATRAAGAATDLRCARALHRRAVARPRLVRASWWCSRAGDGVTWALLLTPLWWLDVRLARAAFGLAACNLLLYWALKHWTRRERPCARWHADFVAGERAADCWSFPSGHTLHAVSFAVLLSAWEPLLTPLLAAFAAAVGTSRVMLGVHYPSDVLAGAAIGAASAAVAAQSLV